MKQSRLLLLFVLTSLFSFAQNNNATLRLKSGNIVLQPNITKVIVDSLTKTLVRYNNKASVVLQFEAIPSTDTRKYLSAHGIELLDYIPTNAYISIITGTLDFSVLQVARARSIVQLSPQQKMYAALAYDQIPAYAVKVQGTVDVWISFSKTFSLLEVLNALHQKNIDVLPSEFSNYGIVALRIATNRLSELASLPFIEYVQPAPPKDQPLNYNSRATSRANVLNASAANGGRGLDGSGVVVGVGDNADVQTHPDFTYRLINRSYEAARGHGHHVTGTVAGAGNVDEAFTGYAPKATIVSTTYQSIWINATTYVQDYGMVLTNNSYGNIVADCNYAGLYDLYSRVLDQQAIDLPNLQHVFAAGNDGGLSCNGLPSGFRTVLGGYQSAKNVLTVGGTTYNGGIAVFSSRGPVKDGRIKPEIAAMGSGVISAWPVSIYPYSINYGTSMAAPGVTGGLTLLYQRYKQLNGGVNPKNGLMKAILCNGASDAGNAGPDYTYGFGNMNLLRSIDILESNHYLTSTITNGSTNTHSISVPANTAQLKVLLYWNDPAAAALSSQALVNDLDLEVADPSSITSYPKINDPNNITITATTGPDHINNIEQVTIDNPTSGNYTIKIKGTAITQNPSQEYFVTYDFVPVSLKITNPIGDETWVPSSNAYDSMTVHWEAYGNTTSTYNVDFSSDNGATWTNLASNLAPDVRFYTWYVPNIATDKAKMRVTQNGTGITSISNSFVIMNVPAVSLSAVQCEGYVSIDWTSVANATDYEVMMMKGGKMVSVATTTGNTYLIDGLSKDSQYVVTVRPRINGKSGRRGFGVIRQPNSGSCTGAISDNDLKLDAIVAPSSGRLFTSTALTATTAISIRVKNLDDAAINNFNVKYSVNGSAWISESVSTISASSTYTHTFATTQDFSAVGTYIIKAVVDYAVDPIHANDTLVAVVKQLANNPITLASPLIENFDGAPTQEYKSKQIGLDGLDRFDFSNSTSYGRVRSFINSGMAYSGSNAITLDADRYLYPSSNINYLDGTFNLATYNVSTNDIRLDFRYNNHGQYANPNNSVWIRGNDTAPWVNAYDLFANQLDPGTYKKTSSIELAHLLAAAGQSFSTSFQIRWGQHGYFAATDKENAGGYSFDDVRIYEVFNDLQLVSIDTPTVASCALNATTPVKVTVRNSSSNTLTNIPVMYRIDGGAWTIETITSINANTSLQYTFSALANLSSLGTHTLETVVDLNSDSFHENDTSRATINNLPVLTSFPYLQNFEADNGNWYTGGKNSSWEYGTPASYKIKGAASGAKAWKTRLVGNYNDNELSYLYSPCFDVSGMTTPTLSFAVALDLEDCGSTLCDGVWVEYSADGKTWTKLGTNGSGTNWYNKAGDNVWSVIGYTRYHVATFALPTTNNNRLRLRFVLSSDAGVNREGIAVDDIHIYDNTNGIYNGVTMAGPVTQTVSGTGWTDFTSGGQLIASIQPNNQNMGSTDVQAYIYPSGSSSGTRRTSTQYYHDRNITIKPAITSLTDSVTVRLYFLDKETDSLIFATGCSGCSKPAGAYELGVSKYTDPDKTKEDGTIANDLSGNWAFIVPSKVTKVPFDKGYYAEFKVKDFSEFWLNNGAFNQQTPLPLTLLNFTAQKQQNTKALLQWTTTNEVAVNRFEIEVARGNAAIQLNQFVKIGEVAAHNNTSQQQYSFIDEEQPKSGVRYYRLKMIDIDGRYTYSPVRSVLFSNDIMWQVFPNPSNGPFHLLYQVNSGEVVTIKITDASGKTIRENKITGSGFVEKYTVDLSGKASGAYLLQATAGDRTTSFKLYKQ
ncbi:MAG: peptidase S8/S53 subtilisin kexin sedolisin [Chitinophagaceae bacterium]